MSYNVNKTDGTTILVLDGTKDTTSTSLTLFGRLVQNYGDQTNENFVHLLENFALDTSPANPITGQLWFDTSVNNIKHYDGTDWVIVGTNIAGNVDVAGNLTVGGGGNLEIKELDGLVHITNTNNDGNVAFFANVGGTYTNVLNIDGSTGLITVAANATAEMGVTPKLQVESIDADNRYDTHVAMAANVAIVNASLTAANLEIDTTQANIGAFQTFSNTSFSLTSANLGTVVGTTIPNLNANIGAFQTYANTNITSINANLGVRVNNETQLTADIAGANASISTLSARLDSVNTAQTAALTANVNLKADIDSASLTGTPTAPTAAFGANTSQIATTNYVMTRSEFWDGSRKFVSTSDPTASDGDNGDIWFKYTP